MTEVPFEYFSPIGVMRLVPQPVWPLIYTTDEVLSPLCLFYKGFRRIWIVVMFAFHVVTGLFMQIWFTANFLLILVFLTDSDRWLAGWLPQRLTENS